MNNNLVVERGRIDVFLKVNLLFIFYKYLRIGICFFVDSEVFFWIYNLLNEGGFEEKWWEV